MTGLITAGIVSGGARGGRPAASRPTAIIVGTLLLDGSLVAVALLFASFVRRPQPWHFGLRRTPFWPAVGWAALGMFSFYVFAAIYSVAVQPDVEQTVAEDLGADEGTFGLVAAGFMIICVAPFAEEFFFRGFFYGALRTRFSVAAAAIIDGARVRADPLRGRHRRAPDRAPARAARRCLLPRVRADAARSTRSSPCTRSTTRSPTPPRRTAGRSSAVLGPLMVVALRRSCPASRGRLRRPWHSDAQMNSRFLALSIAALLASGAAPAAAQDPAARPPEPAGGSELPSGGGLATEKVRYYAPAQQVVLRGRVTPGGARRGRHAVRDPQGQGRARRSGARCAAAAASTFRFKVGKPGLVRLVVKHAAQRGAAGVPHRAADDPGRRLAGRRGRARA